MALVEGRQAEAMKPIESPAALWDSLRERGVHLSAEVYWWHSDQRISLRVRDPMFCLRQADRRAIAFWEADLLARVTEWSGDPAPLPSTWRHPHAPLQGVIDVPIAAIEGAEAAHVIRVDNSGKCETL